MTTHTQLISSQVLAPKRHMLPHGSLLAVAMSLCAVGALTGAAILGNHALHASKPEASTVNVVVMNKAPPTPEPVPIAQPAEPAPVEAVATPTPEPEPTTPPVPKNAEYALVFDFDGQSYVAIDLVEQPSPWNEEDTTKAEFPAHGQLRLIGEPDYPNGVIASLEAKDLADDVAAWRDHPLLIDNRCDAKVTDFALIGLISGEPIYFLDEAEMKDKRKQAKAVLRYSNAVIAGRLDGCKVTGGIARSASLPLALQAQSVRDDDAIERARKLMLASDVSAKAQRTYQEDTGETRKWWTDEYLTKNDKIFRHPRTGKTLVSVQLGNDGGCGSPQINLWGLYELAADGQLKPLQVIDTGSTHSIDEAIDLDGDGTFEFLVDDYNAATVLSMDNKSLRVLERPFYGCSC